MADFYVDLSAGSAGSGSFASPWNRLTLITGLVGGVDKVWVRRVTFNDTTTHLGWAPPTNIPIIGWPLSTDEDYASRPVAAQATWDPDAGTHATVDLTDPSPTTATRVMVNFGAINVTLKRIQLIYRAGNTIGATGNSHGCLAMTNGSGSLNMYRCALRFLPVGTFTGPAFTSQNGPFLFNISGTTFTGAPSVNVRETILENGMDTAGSAGNACVSGALSDSAANFLSAVPGFSDCTLRLSGQATRERWIASQGNFSYRFNGNFLRCTFESTVARGGTQDILSESGATSDITGSTTPRPLFTECTFTTAVSVPGRARLSHVSGRFVRCAAVNFQALYIGRDANAHFTSFIQGAAENVFTAAIETGNSGPSVVMDFLQLQAGNNVDIYMAPHKAANVIIRNIIEGTGGYAPVSSNGRIMLANLNNLVGTWKSIATEGTVETSANTRVGGEAFCLIMKPAAGGGSFPTEAAATGLRTAWPGEDTTFVSLATGSRTVTVYGYYGGYTVPPTQANVWISVEYPTATGLVTVISRATGAVTSDSSTWNGFSGGTAFKMAVTFTAPADCVGAVRVTSIAFETATAYIAIDPKPVVT